MGNENKNEKAGAQTPATPSKVEGTQEKAQTNQVDSNVNAEIESLKAKVSEHETTIASKDAEIESLKDTIKKLDTKANKANSKKEKRFIVISPFRSNVKADKEKVFDINDDVTDFDADRLKNLVEKGLVKEI